MLFDAPMSVRFKGASHTLIGKMQDDNAKIHHLFPNFVNAPPKLKFVVRLVEKW